MAVDDDSDGGCDGGTDVQGPDHIDASVPESSHQAT